MYLLCFLKNIFEKNKYLDKLLLNGKISSPKNFDSSGTNSGTVQ